MMINGFICYQATITKNDSSFLQIKTKYLWSKMSDNTCDCDGSLYFSRKREGILDENDVICRLVMLSVVTRLVCTRINGSVTFHNNAFNGGMILSQLSLHGHISAGEDGSNPSVEVLEPAKNVPWTICGERIWGVDVFKDFFKLLNKLLIVNFARHADPSGLAQVLSMNPGKGGSARGMAIQKIGQTEKVVAFGMMVCGEGAC